MDKNIRFTNFVDRLQEMEDDYNRQINRRFNVNTCTKYPRKISRYLTFILFKLNIKAPWVLAAHSISDLVALWFVALGNPLIALGFWLLSHILDNCDGDLARARNELDMKWGEMDVFLHLWANILFWIILALRTDLLFSAMILLGARVVQEYFRQKQTNETRYGERSKIWKFITWPTNVNMIYLSYVIFALWGLVDLYLALYATYFLLAAVGQSTVYVFKTVK